MPALSLPDDLHQQLNETESGTIDSTQGPGVAVCLSSDGRTRADFYIGLKLDGFSYYANISSVDPSIKMQFALKPVVSCQSEVVTFYANQQNAISTKVQTLYLY